MSPSPYAHIADIYDVYVQTALDVPFFTQEARSTHGEVLELMAGTGRLTLPLLQAGARVVALDNAPQMLAVLRDKLKAHGLNAEVLEMDVRALALDRQFDLILIPFHAFAELPTVADQRATLERIYAHLSPNGRFICALHNPPVRLKSVDGMLRLVNDSPYKDGKLLLWLLQSFDASGEQVIVRQFFEEYDAAGLMQARRLMQLEVRFVAKAAFEALATVAGFRTAALYGDYAYAPFDEATSPFMIWVLQK